MSRSSLPLSGAGAIVRARHFGLVMLTGLALTLSACGGSSNASGSGNSGNNSGDGTGSAGGSATAAQINSTLDGFVPNTVDGYSFVMVNKTGTLDSHAAGSVNLNDPVILASASKGPAMAAILTLVDQGKLNLDDTVSSILQNANSPVTWPLLKSTITLRMLMDHTSGLPGLTSVNQPACINVTNLNAANSESMQQCVQDIANSVLDAVPGTAFIYGGADYQVAGYIATLVSGASTWQSFFQSALAQPLGASTLTYFAGQSNPRVSGGAEASAPDYAKFLQMLLNDGQYNGQTILSATSAEALRTNQIGVLTATPPVGAAADHFTKYSFGFFQDAASIYNPSPGPEFSDQGLFGSTPWIDYGLNYAAVILLASPYTSPVNPGTLQTGTAMWDAVHAQAITLAQQP